MAVIDRERGVEAYRRHAVTAGRASPAHRWYVLSVVPAAQLSVCRRARELGVETYCPMSRTPPRLRKFGRDRFADGQTGVGPGHSRRRVAEAETRPLMPGYVFVALSQPPRFDLFQRREPGSPHSDPLPEHVEAGYVHDRARPSVEPIRGCLGFIATKDGPTAIGEAVIQTMRLREAAGEFDLTARTEDGKGFVARWVKRGASVEFVEGPFASFFGVIMEVPSATMVKVEASIFGRLSPIDAPLDWIRRVR